MFQTQSAPSDREQRSTSGARMRVSQLRAARPRRPRASSTSDAARVERERRARGDRAPRRRRARVMPQNGHGMPVAARSGHASGGCDGQQRPHGRDADESPRRATRSSRASRSSTVRRRLHGVHDTPVASRAGLLRDDDAFEQVLGVAVRRDAGDPRRQPVRELAARSSARAGERQRRAGGRGTGGSPAGRRRRPPRRPTSRPRRAGR